MEKLMSPETLNITIINPDVRNLLLNLEELNLISINNNSSKAKILADIKGALVEVKSFENNEKVATSIEEFMLELENEK